MKFLQKCSVLGLWADFGVIKRNKPQSSRHWKISCGQDAVLSEATAEGCADLLPGKAGALPRRCCACGSGFAQMMQILQNRDPELDCQRATLNHGSCGSTGGSCQPRGSCRAGAAGRGGSSGCAHSAGGKVLLW